MDYVKAIRNRLSDITPITDDTILPNPEAFVRITYDENPLNPYLFSYCFDNILGFRVNYHLFEKVNYVIDFAFKGITCHAIDCKHEFTVSIHADLKPGFINLMKEIKILLEQFFLECGKEAMEKNAVTMQNYYPRYHNKFLFYENQISALESKMKAVNQHLIQYMHKNANNHAESVSKSHNKIQPLLSEWKDEQAYHIESYIDTFFSLLEHLLTLLYPFTDLFDRNTSYCTKYAQNSHWTWAQKMIDVCGNSDEVNSLIDKLREIKEVFRNRFTHGMFSRELMMYTQIEGFGRYPMFLGKDYLKGFVDNYNTAITYERFKEFSITFHSVLSLIEEKFPIPLVFIEGGIDIPVITKELTDEITTIDSARDRVDYLLYMYDRELNMDW